MGWMVGIMWPRYAARILNVSSELRADGDCFLFLLCGKIPANSAGGWNAVFCCGGVWRWTGRYHHHFGETGAESRRAERTRKRSVEVVILRKLDKFLSRRHEF